METKKTLDLEEAKIQESIDTMVEDGSLIQDQEALYLPPFFHSEVGVARRIREIVSTPTSLDIDGIDKIIRSIEERDRIKYDQVQKEAIKRAASSKFMVLTGGPGTGKTFTILGIIRVFERIGAKIYLAAPTGRAAKKNGRVHWEGGKDHPQDAGV